MNTRERALHVPGDPVQIAVVCPACRRRWTSHAAGGRTRCRECGERVYVPAQARREAEEHPGRLVYDAGTGRLAWAS